MLDKLSEKILAFIISEYQKTPGKSVVINSSDFGLTDAELDNLCLNLYNVGLLNDVAYSDTKSPTAVLLSYKGLHYFKTDRRDKFRFWLPVIISIIALLRPEIINIIKLILKK